MSYNISRFRIDNLRDFAISMKQVAKMDAVSLKPKLNQDGGLDRLTVGIPGVEEGYITGRVVDEMLVIDVVAFWGRGKCEGICPMGTGV